LNVETDHTPFLTTVPGVDQNKLPKCDVIPAKPQTIPVWEVYEACQRQLKGRALNIDRRSMSLAFEKKALQKVQRNALHVPSTGIHPLQLGSWRWSRNLDPARRFQRRHLTIDELHRNKEGTKTLPYHTSFSYKDQIENV